MMIWESIRPQQQWYLGPPVGRCRSGTLGTFRLTSGSAKSWARSHGLGFTVLGFRIWEFWNLDFWV